jgi:hypothetical protein
METAYKKEDNYPDFVLLLVTLLAVVGTAMILFPSSIIALEKFNDGQYFLKKQLVFVFLGFTIMVAMTKVPYTHLEKNRLSGNAAVPAVTVPVVVAGYRHAPGGRHPLAESGRLFFSGDGNGKNHDRDFFVASADTEGFSDNKFYKGGACPAGCHVGGHDAHSAGT